MQVQWSDLYFPPINLFNFPSWFSYTEKVTTYPKREYIQNSIELHGITIKYIFKDEE